jgi:hypothetical protein
MTALELANKLEEDLSSIVYLNTSMPKRLGAAITMLRLQHSQIEMLEEELKAMREQLK